MYKGFEIVTMPLVKKGYLVTDEETKDKYIFINDGISKQEKDFVISSLIKRGENAQNRFEQSFTLRFQSVLSLDFRYQISPQGNQQSDA